MTRGEIWERVCQLHDEIGPLAREINKRRAEIKRLMRELNHATSEPVPGLAGEEDRGRSRTAA